MATTVTIKGQVTIPKAVRDAAGIRPGDRVEMRALPEGGVLVERDPETSAPNIDAIKTARQKIETALANLDRSQLTFPEGMTTDEIMRLLRDDD